MSHWHLLSFHRRGSDEGFHWDGNWIGGFNLDKFITRETTEIRSTSYTTYIIHTSASRWNFNGNKIVGDKGSTINFQ